MVTSVAWDGPALPRESVYVRRSPATIGSTSSVFEIDRSETSMTVTVCVSVLSAGSSPGVEVVAVAEFTTSPLTSAPAWTVSVMVSVEPATTVPRSQVTELSHDLRAGTTGNGRVHEGETGRQDVVDHNDQSV